MHSVLLQVICCVVLSPLAGPEYALEVKPSKRVETVYTISFEAPKLVAKEWELFVAAAPELPGQKGAKMSSEPAGEIVTELGAEKRSLLRVRIPVTDAKFQKQGSLRVQCLATLNSRMLVARPASGTAPAVAGLTADEKLRYISPTAMVDSASADFQRWLDERKLHRLAGETDVAFARRIFLALKQQFTYEYKTQMDRHASAVCRAGKSDCGGLANVFVATLRAEGLPARTLVGRWAKSASAGEKVGEVDYFQQHVKAEFFANGVGWVPVDLSSAVLYDRAPGGQRFFGNDSGDFLTLHVDGDLAVETHYFGAHTIPWLQGAAFWVTGTGTLEGMASRENWQVRVLK